jgi:RNA polymerase sigma factor (sigma-70 family)
VRAADSNSASGPAAVFATTHWSVVLEAGENESAGSRAALEKLCRNYWRPIYTYIRRRGHAAHEAEDLTQSFLAHFLERKLLSVVDRQRGRFRTFVLHACEYFLAKEWRNASRLKRGGGHQIISLDVLAAEECYQNEPSDQITPERLYERQWVLSLLELAFERLRHEWIVAGKSTLFDTLQLFLSGEGKSMTCAQAALELGLSEGAVRTAVHRLRQQYAEILRAEVRQTLSREEDLEEELRHLLSVL